jgi:hypothetical protein
MSEDTVVKIGDEDVSLADIAGVDMSQVEEFRFENTPKGIYQWVCKNAEVVKLGNKPAIRYELEASNVIALSDDSLDPDKYVGHKHNEAIFITDLEKDIGRAKAFMIDAGFEGSGTLQELLDQFVGHEFISAIGHRKDKNDTDKVYANIDYGKVKPLEEAA